MDLFLQLEKEEQNYGLSKFGLYIKNGLFHQTTLLGHVSLEITIVLLRL